MKDDGTKDDDGGTAAASGEEGAANDTIPFPPSAAVVEGTPHDGPLAIGGSLLAPPLHGNGAAAAEACDFSGGPNGADSKNDCPVVCSGNPPPNKNEEEEGGEKERKDVLGEKVEEPKSVSLNSDGPNPGCGEEADSGDGTGGGGGGGGGGHAGSGCPWPTPLPCHPFARYFNSRTTRFTNFTPAFWMSGSGKRGPKDRMRRGSSVSSARAVPQERVYEEEERGGGLAWERGGEEAKRPPINKEEGAGSTEEEEEEEKGGGIRTGSVCLSRSPFGSSGMGWLAVP